MARDPLKYFRIEAKDLLDRLGQGVLALEQSRNVSEAVASLLRVAHTLKGAARVVKQREIADHAHALEDDLAPLRGSTGPVPAEVISVLLRRLDDIAKGVVQLQTPVPESAPPESTPVLIDATRSVRADMAEVDGLLDGCDELYGLLGGLRRGLTCVAQCQERISQLQIRLAAPANSGAEGQRAYRVQTGGLAEECRSLLGSAARTMTHYVEHIDRELAQVRETAERMRLVPAATAFSALERAARDVALSEGKRVRFQASGGDISLDANVLDALRDAAIQLVRNAVAHGIEVPEERVRRGKPEEGHVLVRLERRGRRLALTCSDDGRGVDRDAVWRVAQAHGLGADIGDLDDPAVLQRVLTHSGISTAGKVTDAAGRGVGLDVARRAVERLGGSLQVSSSAQRGTAMTLTAPLSLAAIDALTVSVGSESLCFPLDAVQCGVRVASDELTRTGVEDRVAWEGAMIPFLPLETVLRPEATARRARAWTAVIVRGAGGPVAVGVDRIVGVGTIVVRPLPPPGQSAGFVAGACLDVQDGPRLVVDPDGLIAAVRAGRLVSEPTRARAPILIVDDSLTTRMLEESILLSAGYAAELASSAEEALEMAARRDYALFLVDVEMPGMDGFGFLEHIRADERLSRTPAILVTSRASVDDRERGRRLGAVAHLAKNEFDQRELLACIGSIVP
ncbi:hybrid sensor histidine kinase/response regulator [Tahibacter amnicola]|uniref:histidine kinase n=1 Tax=Tahibacter amnicola TaxID=2976241 RepID=A0ABY6B9A6_9GAMM|nr:hybrid sensor histidine kinase/response regulator [Tahibacter amnicola]UXI66651.1 response regulator [Tahibacter amnicola]